MRRKFIGNFSPLLYFVLCILQVKREKEKRREDVERIEMGHDGNAGSSARLEAFLHLHDLAAAIHAGLQVDVMRTVKFAGRLVLDIGVALQGVMSAAHVALRARDL